MSIPQKFKKLSFIFSGTVTLVGFFVLIGWIGNIPFLKSISPYWISMKANAAICFLLAGITLILANRAKKNTAAKWITLLFSVIIFIIGTITLLEYVFEFNAGIDELFFKDEVGSFAELPRGRQSLFSAAYFMLFGFCYLPGINKMMKTSLFQFLHIASGIIVLAAAMSYVLGSYVIAGVSLNFIYVIHSTLSFLFLILAVLFSQPEEGIMKLVSSNSSGGKIIRTTLPSSVIVFIVIGWLRLEGEKAGFYNRELGISIFIILMIIIMGYLIFSSAASSTKSEEILMRSEERLIRTNENLELAEKQANLGNWEFDVRSQFIHWSKQMFRLFELEPAEKAPSNKELFELIHPDDRASIIKILDHLQEQKEKENIVFRTNPKKIPLKYLYPTWHVVKDDKGMPINFFGTLQDITERVKTRKALKQSEEKFSKAFHSNVLGFAIYDEDFRIVDINEPYAAILESARDELLGKSSDEAGLISKINPEKREAISQEIEVILNIDGQLSNFETEIETKNGELVTVLLSIEKLELDDKKYWLTSVIDITAKKRAEILVQQSELKYRTIIEQAADGIFLADADTYIIDVNRASCQMLGYTKEELLNMKYTSLIPTEDLVDNPVLITRLKREGTVINERRLLRKDGSIINVEISAKVLSDGRYQSIIRDITERKKAEQQLLESELQFRSLFEQATDCVLLCGIDASIIKVNSSGSVISGYSTEELLRMNATELFFEEDIKQNPLRIQELLDGKSVLNDRRLKKKDGTSAVVEINTKMMADGRLLSIVRDISERKKVEKQLAENEQRLNRAELMGSLGHGYYNIKNGSMHLSEGLYKIFGVTPETFSHTIDGLRSVIHPDDFLIQQQAVETMFTKGEVEVEFRIVRPGGEVRNVLFKTRLTKNEKGELIDSFTTALCVTDRKKAQKELEESFSVLEATLESTADGILVANSQGKIIRFNKKFAELWHIPQDILQTGDDSKAIDFVLDQLKTPEKFLSKIKELYADPEAVSFDTLEFKDGRVFERYSQPQVINGQSFGRVWSFRDVTERKKAEEELQLSEQKYKLLFYNNPLPMWMATIPDLDIVDVNESAIKQYGYSREEFLKLNTIDMRPAEDVEYFLKEVEKMKGGVINTRSWRHKKKDGTIIQVETHSHQIMYEGRPVWLGLSNNVTEKFNARELLQKSYEEIRQLASNLQSIREDERTNIAREIHDELGQQLTGLKMDIHWLSRKIKSADKEINNKMKESIELINATITSVRKIATDLRPSILDDLGLMAALEWQGEEFEKRSGTKVKFINNAGDLEVRPEVATAIFRIYQELLTNIARHANARLVTASLNIEEQTLWFSIKDNGVGFNADTIGSKKTLGLLGIKERTLLMGGTYEIKTRPGEGSETIISIPLTLAKTTG